MQDRDTGNSRGFAFATFGNPQEADMAVGSMNEQMYPPPVPSRQTAN